MVTKPANLIIKDHIFASSLDSTLIFPLGKPYYKKRKQHNEILETRTTKPMNTEHQPSKKTVLNVYSQRKN